MATTPLRFVVLRTGHMRFQRGPRGQGPHSPARKKMERVNWTVINVNRPQIAQGNYVAFDVPRKSGVSCTYSEGTK